MNNQNVNFIFKLRENIDLEGDLLLAKMELETFIPSIDDIDDIDTLLTKFPVLSQLHGFGDLGKYVRRQGKQAFIGSGSLEIITDLIKRVTFIQRIYCITEDYETKIDIVTKIENEVGPVISYETYDKYLVIQAVPHYLIFELSSVIAKKSKGIADTKNNLQFTLEALLDKINDRHAVTLVEKALSAKNTSSPLSHDIHYYKAKFFPRMARSLLNISSQRMGNGPHRIIDNFVGSGTTLLEASTLGHPSMGIDIDSLSVMITKAKLELLHLDSKLLQDEVETVKLCMEKLDKKTQLLEIASSEKYGAESLQFPSWLMKNRKMTPEIANELAHEIILIQSSIRNCDPDVKNIFNVVLSDTISRKIKMRFLGTGVGRFSLTFAKTPLRQIFIQSLDYCVKVAAVCEWLQHTVHLQFAEAQVIEGNAKQVPETIGKFDILLTSPPYLPASSGRESYAMARAPSLIALGLKTHEEIETLVENSIGSMGLSYLNLDMLTDNERKVVDWILNDELRKTKAIPTAKYFLDMRQTFKEMHRILNPNSIATVISGKQSTFYKYSTREILFVVNSAELLAEEITNNCFKITAIHDIQLKKSNMNARPRSLDNYFETLLIFEKNNQVK